ncbi:MAG: hypothetical protein SWH54_13060 [Thermodesulfobacteriota bacterium]|nr:hypothetical protein [Thermodesulfobacteriota bacterium]
MKNKSKGRNLLDEHLGCYGEFNSNDPICKKFCALNIKCAIDSNQNNLMEFLEDLVSSDEIFLKIQ